MEWILPSSSQIKIIPSIPSLPINEHRSIREKKMKELVFTGPMTTMNGLAVFCSMLELVHQDLANAHIKVTFLGPSSFVGQLTSEEYIDIQSSLWDSSDLSWSIHVVEDIKEIIDYLIEPGTGRIAVVPSLYDSTGYITQEIIFAQIPLIGSLSSSIKDYIDPTHIPLTLFAPGDVIALSNAVRRTIDSPGMLCVYY